MNFHFYGTVPVLAWMLNHYFYGGVHFSWLAEGFHPLRSNPKSSNPYLIYGDLYAAWAHNDIHDKFVAQSRISLRAGVVAQQARGAVDEATADRLRDVCEHVGVEFFYPVVLRVDLYASAPERRERANSGLSGSREFLVRDLAETEFDLLFADNDGDRDFCRLVTQQRSGQRRTEPEQALELLEGRM